MCMRERERVRVRVRVCVCVCVCVCGVWLKVKIPRPDFQRLRLRRSGVWSKNLHFSQTLLVVPSGVPGPQGSKNLPSISLGSSCSEI